MAESFLSNLPSVPAKSLPAGSECPICTNGYSTPSSKKGPTDNPVRLPCGHILGRACITRWLSPSESGATTCPLCRHQLFTPTPNDQSRAAAPLAWNVRAARRTLPAREERLYMQLRREGARLPVLPANSVGVSQNGVVASSAALQRLDRNEEAFFGELQRMGAFDEPGGSRRRGDDDRGLANRVRWSEYRSRGLVYCPGDVLRRGEWVLR